MRAVALRLSAGATVHGATRGVHDAADEHRAHVRRTSSLYGLNAGIIDRTQFSLLISVVVLSAIVPTFLAQRFFQPHAQLELEPPQEVA